MVHPQVVSLAAIPYLIDLGPAVFYVFDKQIRIIQVHYLNRSFLALLTVVIDVSLLDLWQPLVWQHPTWFWCISRVTSM